MRWVLSVLLLLHGLIHFAGLARALGGSISRAAGALWLAAGLVLLATAALVIVAPRVWWAWGFAAIVLSQVAIAGSWGDAKFGTIANIVILAAVAYGFAAQGPLSLRAEYRRAVRERLAQPVALPLVTEADLAPLPEPVQRYLRVTESVGKPRVRHFRATWRGRIRGTPSDPWMSFTAEQHNFLAEPARFFFMDARHGGLPVDVLHAFQGGSATMRVRLLSLVPLVNVGGADPTRAETVTLLNDLCLLAPAALIDPAIRWEPIDAHSARAHYTVGANTIGAVLSFNDAGELADFVSDDRLAASADGKRFTRLRWSTPVAEYRAFGGRSVSTRGEGRWHPPEGEFVYIELELLDLQVNGGR